MESFLDQNHEPHLHVEFRDRIGIVPEKRLHPIVEKLVSAAMSKDMVSNIAIRIIDDIYVGDGSLEESEHALVDGDVVLPLGKCVPEALRLLSYTFGQAMDEAVKRSKDTRIVDLYKALKAVPDSERTLDALWNIMTKEEQQQADISRAFDGFSSLKQMPDEQPEDE
jgi:hypothetical protein